MTTQLAQAYDSGVLDPTVHGRLVANLEQYARRANIQDAMILGKMSQFECTAEEINYVRSIRRMSSEGSYGLVYLGRETKPVMTRMMAVAGACLRNFIDAKVMVIQDLLAQLKDGNPPEATVLLVPNFFIARAEGGRIAEWNVAELLGLLYARMAQGKQTFLYVSDFDALRKTYGDPIAMHLQNSFRAVAA